MFELLNVVLEILVEVLFQIAAEAVTARAVRAVRKEAGGSEPFHPVLAGAGYLVLGAVCGVASVLIYPHPFFHPSRIHGISLVVSPVVTGLVMWRVGLVRRRWGRDVLPLESFGYGFTFALGVAVMRFLYVG